MTDEVYAQIVEAISSGEVKADDRLVQEKLATELQISRTPVREALIRLEQEGMLVSSPRGGFVIHRLEPNEIKKIYQARAAIEAQAARILASNNDPQSNSRLKALIATEENIESTTTKAYFTANRNIHRAFIEACDNRYLLEMFDNIWNRASSFQTFAELGSLDLAKSLGHHIALVEAIETGDVTKTTDVVIDHIFDGLNLQLEAITHRE